VYFILRMCCCNHIVFLVVFWMWCIVLCLVPYPAWICGMHLFIMSYPRLPFLWWIQINPYLTPNTLYKMTVQAKCNKYSHLSHTKKFSRVTTVTNKKLSLNRHYTASDVQKVESFISSTQFVWNRMILDLV